MRLSDLSLPPDVVDQILWDLPAPYGVPRPAAVTPAVTPVVPDKSATPPLPVAPGTPLPPSTTVKTGTVAPGSRVSLLAVAAGAGTGLLVGGPPGALVGAAAGLLVRVKGP